MLQVVSRISASYLASNTLPKLLLSHPETTSQQAPHKGPVIPSHRTVTKIVTLTLQLQLSLLSPPFQTFSFPFCFPLPLSISLYLLLHYVFLPPLKEMLHNLWADIGPLTEGANFISTLSTFLLSIKKTRHYLMARSSQ